jgi:hypothetical protein
MQTVLIEGACPMFGSNVPPQGCEWNDGSNSPAIGPEQNPFTWQRQLSTIHAIRLGLTVRTFPEPAEWQMAAFAGANIG